MKLPTEQEINIHNTPDEIFACEYFLNKTLGEAELLFREYDCLEHLMWMGPKAFAFYMQAVANYIKSDFANRDSDFVSFLHAVIESHLDNPEFSLALPTILGITDYVIFNYSKFDINHEKYGDLKSKYIQLRNDLVNML